MPNIESLSFELLIDDKQFNNKIAEIKKMADDLNTSVSSALNIGGTSSKDMIAAVKAYQIELEKAVKLKQQQGLITAKQAASELRQIRIQAQERISAYKVETEAMKGMEVLRHQAQMNATSEAAAAEKVAQAEQKKVEAKKRAQTAEINRQNAEARGLNIAKQGEIAEINKETAKLRQEQAQIRLNRLQEEGNKKVSRTSRILRDVGTLAMTYFSVQGATSLVRNLINITAEFEKQRVSLQAILRDADGANALFDRIKDLAVLSPFSFKELVTYTKQLSAYSIPMGELYDTTKMLADVSAGLGVGMDRLVLAYGQIRSAAFLRGTEVRQLTEAGVPILNELAKQIEELEGKAVSVGEVFDRISSRQISFQMVEKVFKDMTSEGGKFYNMQETLATTLSGKLSNLTDAYQIMFSEIGDKNKGMMVAAVDLARSLAENYEKVGRALTELIAAYGTYKAVLAITQLANGTFIASNTKLIASITNVKKALSTAVLSNPYAIVAAGVTALIYSLYKLGDAFFGVNEIQKAYDKSMAESQAHIEGEVSRLDKLYASLNLAKEGTDEYYAARKAIMGQYSEYIAKLKEEGKAVDDLKGIYVDLMAKVRQAAVERYNSVALKSAQDALDKVEDEISKSFAKRFDKGMIGGPKGLKNATETQKQAILQWIFGTMSTEDATEYVQRSWLGFFQWMKTDYQKAADTYTKISQDIVKANTDLNKNLGNTEQLTEFTKRVQETLASFGYTEKNKDSVAALWADQYTDQIEYIDQLRSRRSAILKQEAELASYETSKKKALEDELKIINAIFKATEYSPTAPSVIEETSKDTSKERISGIQSQIKAYQKLKDIYNELVQYMSQGDAKQLMATFLPEYGEMIYKDFDNEIINLGQSLANMGKEGKDAANALGLAFGEDKIKAYIDNIKKARKAEEDYANLMDNWGEVFSFGGEGAEFNISKIIADYKKNIEKIMKQRRDVRDALYAREDDVDYELEETKIDDNTFTSMRNALAKANEDVRKQAEAWVKNWDGFEGIDLSRMSELTINELKNLRSQLDVLKDKPLADFPEELKAQLTESGISIDIFTDAVKKAIDELDKKTKEQERKAVVEKLKSYADGFKKAADGVKSLGEATNNTDLTDFAEQMSNIADTAVKMAEAWADGNTAGVIVTAASYVANAWLEAIAGAERFKATIQDLSLEMLELRYQSQLASGTDTIFGDNTYRSLKNASDTIGQLQSKMDGLQSKLDGITISTKKSKWWEFFLAPTGTAAWAKLFTNKSFSVTEALQQMGTDLMLENGKVNVDALQKLVDAYDGFSKAEKEAMELAITEAQAYNDALDQLNSSMESLVGSVAGDFASAIVEQWKSAGDAAADYSEILDGLATQYAEMMIQNTLLEHIFDDDFKKKITDMTVAKDSAGVLDLFDSKVKQLEEYYPTFTEILEGLDKYFIDEGSTNENATLANGIKGITEDTANLLASYVNAIRADVSYNKMQLQQILGLLPSSPTLADYLTQIQANTYNTAEHTRVLMENINSVMTTSDGPAIRVFM